MIVGFLRGDHVLVTRGGEMLRGRLMAIEGGEGSAKPNEPRVVTFQAGGERRLPMGDVARLYLGNYPQTAGDSGSATVLPAGAPTEAPTSTSVRKWRSAATG
jgi:hypothetical protein